MSAHWANELYTVGWAILIIAGIASIIRDWRVRKVPKGTTAAYLKEQEKK